MRNCVLLFLFILTSINFLAQSNTKIADSLYAVGQYNEAIKILKKEKVSSVNILADLAKNYKANSL